MDFMSVSMDVSVSLQDEVIGTSRWQIHEVILGKGELVSMVSEDVMVELD